MWRCEKWCCSLGARGLDYTQLDRRLYNWICGGKDLVLLPGFAVAGTEYFEEAEHDRLSVDSLGMF